MPRICVLMYHMVAEPRIDRERPYACPPKRFASHMKALRDRGYAPVSLAQVHRHLAGTADLPEFPVAVTLDDGFADNYTDAFPILRKYEIPATIFLAVSTLGGDNRWMTATGYPSRPMLDWDQIREMQAAGIGFGSHTLTHPRLSQLGRDTASREINDSKQALEERLGIPVDHFAYPHGDWSDATVELVREAGYSLACSTRSGFNRRDVDPMLLRRIEVYGTDPAWKLLQKLRFGTNDAGLLEPAKYYWKRVASRVKGA